MLTIAVPLFNVELIGQPVMRALIYNEPIICFSAQDELLKTTVSSGTFFVISSCSTPNSLFFSSFLSAAYFAPWPPWCLAPYNKKFDMYILYIFWAREQFD